MVIQRMWTKEELDFLRKNHEKMSFKEISEKLNRNYSSIENKSHRLGLNRERKHQYNIDFFKKPISNEHSAYWLGFIYADGWVSGRGIGICLKDSDYEHLKKFNKSLRGNIPVTFQEKPERHIVGKTAKPSKICLIRLYSKSMVLDLNNLGVYSDKSLSMEFPMFKDENIQWVFIRGYFDGDGSIYYNENSNQLRCKITSGSMRFKTDFANFLEKNSIKTYTSGKYDCGITGKESTRIFLSAIYDNANIYLDRKYKKYQNYKYLFGFNKQ